MDKFENKIKEYFLKMEPSLLDLPHHIKSIKVSRIGLGESNLNYMVNVESRKYVLRINMYPAAKDSARYKDYDIIIY